MQKTVSFFAQALDEELGIILYQGGELH